MPPKPLTTAQLKQARDVDDLLKAVASELDTAQNPNRIGLRLLKMDQVLGFVKTPYHADAFKVWGDVLHREPHNHEARHHLAIMHHARAIDLEPTDPDGATADWDAALGHWHALWAEGAFWQHIAERAFPHANDKPEVRAEAAARLRAGFPVRLLQIHLDIAFHPDTLRARFPRARYHLHAALGSPFPDEAKAAVRKVAYERFVHGLPEEVWNPDTLDPDKIKIGTDRISTYLDLDPECAFALADLLRLQVRLVRSWFGEFQAMGEDDRAGRDAILARFKSAADAWRPYLDQLPPLVGQLDEVQRGDVRQKLCLWYRWMGDVHRALGKYEAATDFFDQGARAGTEEEEDHRRCVKGAGESMALLARERAGAKAPSAKHYADKTRATPNLSPLAHLFLAQAYRALSEFDTAQAVCEAVLGDGGYQGTDIDEMQEYQELLEDLRKLLANIEEGRQNHAVGPRLDRAKEHMKNDRFAEAAEELDAALKEAPRAPLVPYLRCQCHLALEHAREARRDLELFKSLAGAHDAREAAAQLQDDLDQLEDMIKKFGEQGLHHRRAAIGAFNRGDLEAAVTSARLAVAGAAPLGRAELQKELVTCLEAWAAKQVNTAMDDDAVPLAAKSTAVRAGVALLEEALKLAPADARLKKDLETLRGLEGQLGRAIFHEARERELIREYGGKRAMELQQQAVGAFNAGKLDDAVRLLREALAESRGPKTPPNPLLAKSPLLVRPIAPTRAFAPLSFGEPFGLEPPPHFESAEPGGSTKLKEELSQILMAAAVTKVNSATALTRPAAMSAARLMLQEAVALDPKNTDAKENLNLLSRAM